MIKIPDFHKLKKTKTTEMSREELNRKLRETAERSAKKGYHSKPGAIQSRKQALESKKAKTQMPPQSPVRKRRELETKRRAELELKEKKRRKRGGNNIIYYVMLFVLVVTVFSILSVTVLFNADRIIVEGKSDYTDEQIIEASGLLGTENLITLDLKGVPEKILDALVKLDSVKVEKAFPTAIRITVTPSVPMASFLYGGHRYTVSHTGRVMETDRKNDELMQVVGYKPLEAMAVGKFISSEEPEQDKLISEMISAIEKAELSDKITILDISDNLAIWLTYEDRVKINIGSQLRVDEKLIIAKELLTDGHISASEAVTLNISNPEKVIQRPITSSTSAAPEETVISEPEEAEEGAAEESEVPAE